MSKTNKVTRKSIWYNGRRRGEKPYENYRKVSQATIHKIAVSNKKRGERVKSIEIGHTNFKLFFKEDIIY